MNIFPISKITLLSTKSSLYLRVTTLTRRITSPFTLNSFRISSEIAHIFILLLWYVHNFMQIIIFNIHNSPYLWDQLVQCCLHKHQFQLLYSYCKIPIQRMFKDTIRGGVKSYLNKSLLIINTLLF